MKVQIIHDCDHWDVRDFYYWQVEIGDDLIWGAKQYTSRSNAKRGFLRWRDRALRELETTLYPGNIEWMNE